MKISHFIHSCKNSSDLSSKYSHVQNSINSFLSSGPDAAAKKRLEIYYRNHAGRELYRQRDRFKMVDAGPHGPGFRPYTNSL